MISIHPQFATAIYKGEKQIEFRKLNIPKHVKHVVLYETAPLSKVTGYFSVKSVIETKATTLWERYKNVSGTTKEFFFKYYGPNSIGRGFLVNKVEQLSRPIPLEKVPDISSPPQSFTYVDKDLWASLKRRKKLSLDNPTNNTL